MKFWRTKNFFRRIFSYYFILCLGFIGYCLFENFSDNIEKKILFLSWYCYVQVIYYRYLSQRSIVITFCSIITYLKKKAKKSSFFILWNENNGNKSERLNNTGYQIKQIIIFSSSNFYSLFI